MELEAEQTLADMATSASSHQPRETANGCDEHEHDGLVPYERERLQNIARNNAALRRVGLDGPIAAAAAGPIEKKKAPRRNGRSKTVPAQRVRSKIARAGLRNAAGK